MSDRPTPAPLVVDHGHLRRTSRDQPDLPPLAFTSEQVDQGRRSAEAAIRRLTGRWQPPRSDDDAPVFEAPWQSRAFGMVVALDRAGIVDFAEFQRELVEEISRWEADASEYPGDDWSYYRRWMSALERVVARRKLVDSEQLDRETDALLRHSGHHH
jgi:nitrile hydratase subunit beta